MLFTIARCQIGGVIGNLDCVHVVARHSLTSLAYPLVVIHYGRAAVCVYSLRLPVLVPIRVDFKYFFTLEFLVCDLSSLTWVRLSHRAYIRFAWVE